MLLKLFISACLGFLTGLGTGGGSLLILWLTAVEAVPQDQARLINLMFFIPCALISCLFRWKQGNLDLKKMLPAMIAGSITAGVFSWLSQSWNQVLLTKLFGVLLLLTALRELLYRPKSS